MEKPANHFGPWKISSDEQDFEVIRKAVMRLRAKNGAIPPGSDPESYQKYCLFMEMWYEEMCKAMEIKKKRQSLLKATASVKLR